jgi:PIN domain nuclease of toxin-antitoxin system
LILIDTHIWVWWTHDDTRLRHDHLKILNSPNAFDIGVSVVSCWEVAQLVQRGTLKLQVDIQAWMHAALAPKCIELLPLTPEIAIESTRLPGNFHCDPADRFLVATARLMDRHLMTADRQILDYEHVNTVS